MFTSTSLPQHDVPEDARERILRTSYDLFRRHGVNAVGVDRIVSEAGVAKTTLYRHFRSKDALLVAVLERHEQVWTHGWLARQATARADGSLPRILAVFDALDAWYSADDFEGCLFINTLLETHGRSAAVHTAAVSALANVHALIEQLVGDGAVADTTAFAHQIQILMRGSIVAAVEGHHEAVAEARRVAELLYEREQQS